MSDNSDSQGRRFESCRAYQIKNGEFRFIETRRFLSSFIAGYRKVRKAFDKRIRLVYNFVVKKHHDLVSVKGRGGDEGIRWESGAIPVAVCTGGCRSWREPVIGGNPEKAEWQARD